MISFVCGQLCSGKTLYSKALAQICDGVYIEVGDVVRHLKQTEDRRLLQNSSNLASQIVDYLKSQSLLMSNRDLVISGVRQKEIIESFPDSTLLWVECPTDERKRRYQKRAREGDTQDFEEAEQGDIKLGILEVKQYIFEKNKL